MPAEPILTLGVTHTYGAVALPTVRETQDTVEWLRGRGLGLRPFGDKLLVYRERDDAGQPRARLAAPATLRFLLDVPDPAFATITDLAALAAVPAPVFTNAGTAAGDRVELRLVTRRERTREVLIPRSAGDTVSLMLSQRPEPGAIAADVEATSAAGAVTVSALDTATGIVQLTGPGVVVGTPVTVSYFTQARRPARCLAEVDLVIDQALIDARSAAGRPAQYVIPFTARSLRWCYYVVTSAAVGADAVRLTVGAPAAETRGLAFAAADAKRDLTQLPDVADPIGESVLARQPPGRRVLRFLADQPVALSDRPIRQIALEVDGQRQFENLPNPSPDALGALRGPHGVAPGTEFIHSTITALGG
jgi:hypothetical protein